MRVLHIVAGNLSGGAAKGAYNLHKALIAQGITSHILHNGTEIDDPTVIKVASRNPSGLRNFIIRKWLKQKLKSYQNRDNAIFSTGMVGYDFTHHSLYKKADIVHLHWINNNFVDIQILQKIKKPIVWTIRDMWPLTGGCHYHAMCTKYTSHCGTCPQLNSSDYQDLSYRIFSYKQKYYPQNMTIVAISNWMRDRIKESTLLGHNPITTLYNSIDTTLFTPLNKQEARNSLSIDTNKKIIAIGAHNVEEFYKGFSTFLEALSHLSTDTYFLLVFGNIDTTILTTTGFEYYSTGYVSQESTLQTIYSAADLFVAPSIIEAFGKTIAEAMACRTPVVAYDATGPQTIIEHKVSGYLATPFKPQSLAQGIEWLTTTSAYTEIAQAARERICTTFDTTHSSQQHSQLYEELLNGSL